MSAFDLEVEDALRRLSEAIDAQTDPETRALLERVLRRAMTVATKSLMGEDVSSDVLHLKAQTANLSAALLDTVGTVLEGWIINVAARLIPAVLGRT